MLILPERATVYRMAQKQGGQAGQKTEQAVYQRLPVLILPISPFDREVPFAQESTHRAFLPRWLVDIRRQDELRLGWRTNPSGQRVQYRYVVVGIRRHRSFGLRHTHVYLREME